MRRGFSQRVTALANGNVKLFILNKQPRVINWITQKWQKEKMRKTNRKKALAYFFMLLFSLYLILFGGGGAYIAITFGGYGCHLGHRDIFPKTPVRQWWIASWSTNRVNWQLPLELHVNMRTGVFRVKKAKVTPVKEGVGGFLQLIRYVFQAGKCAMSHK